MIRALVPIAAFAVAAPVVAQEIEITPLEDANILPVTPQVSRQHVTVAPKGVSLRALDKVSGEVVDFDLEPGQTKQLGYLQVSLGECRFPTLNPAGDAYAFLQIRIAGEETPQFAGWMIASSPALNALDHPRYDVWVLRCNNASGD